jgi:hypothetical protein
MVSGFLASGGRRRHPVATPLAPALRIRQSTAAAGPREWVSVFA